MEDDDDDDDVIHYPKRMLDVLCSALLRREGRLGGGWKQELVAMGKEENKRKEGRELLTKMEELNVACLRR